MRNGQRLVCTIRAKANREPSPVDRLLASKSLAWRIFDVGGTCLGVAIIAFTLITVTCALRNHPAGSGPYGTRVMAEGGRDAPNVRLVTKD